MSEFGEHEQTIFKMRAGIMLTDKSVANICRYHQLHLGEYFEKKQTKRCDIFQNTRKRRQWVLILWFLDGSSAAIAMKLQRKWKKEVQKKVRLMMRMLIMAMSKSLIKWELDYVWFTSFKVSWITKNSNQNSPGEIREKLRKTERNSCRYYGNLKP